MGGNVGELKFKTSVILLYLLQGSLSIAHLVYIPDDPQYSCKFKTSKSEFVTHYKHSCNLFRATNNSQTLVIFRAKS